jgi:hypothetical protein
MANQSLNRDSNSGPTEYIGVLTAAPPYSVIGTAMHDGTRTNFNPQDVQCRTF